MAVKVCEKAHKEISQLQSRESVRKEQQSESFRGKSCGKMFIIILHIIY